MDMPFERLSKTYLLSLSGTKSLRDAFGKCASSGLACVPSYARDRWKQEHKGRGKMLWRQSARFEKFDIRILGFI